MNSRSGLIFVRSSPMFCGARLAADGDQNFFGFDLLLLAFCGDGDGNSGFRLFYFVDFRAGVEVNAALAEDAGELFRYFFIFDRDQTRQHFDDGHFAIERSIDRSKFHAYGASADNDQRFRNLLQAQNLDVGQNSVTGFEPGNHAGFRTGCENDILRLEMAGFVVVDYFDGE